MDNMKTDFNLSFYWWIICYPDRTKGLLKWWVVHFGEYPHKLRQQQSGGRMIFYPWKWWGRWQVYIVFCWWFLKRYFQVRVEKVEAIIKMIFMHDNVPLHVVKITNKYLKWFSKIIFWWVDLFLHPIINWHFFYHKLNFTQKIITYILKLNIRMRYWYIFYIYITIHWKNFQTSYVP